VYAAEAEATVEAQAEVMQGNGAIVPEIFSAAVHEYDLSAPTTDAETYAKQVDIFSDEIIAIEAIRLEVMQITQRVEQAEDDF